MTSVSRSMGSDEATGAAFADELPFAADEG